MKGRVVIFWPHKHYGFVIDTASRKEYFFHENSLAQGSAVPTKGQYVTFKLGHFGDREQAIDVTPTGGVR